MDRMHNSVDAALRDRAQRVIPNGMWGHMNVARIPAAYPQYFARAEGCHLWDVDGREYVDFMCAYGPMLLGYNRVSPKAGAALVASVGGDQLIVAGSFGKGRSVAFTSDCGPHWAPPRT